MKSIIFFAFTILLVSCNATTKPTQESKNTLGDTIVLDPNSTLQSKLTTQIIKTELYSVEISTFGIVQAIPNNYAEIAAPFSGRITKSFVRLGQKVAVDDPIFEISSPSFFEAGKIYYQAKQEMQLAQKNLKRQQDLYNNGVGIQKDLEEAEVNFEMYKRDYENARASLQVFKVDPEKLVLGQPLIIRSPIRGEIVSNSIVIGQYLKEEAGPVATVAELSKVWIVGQIKEKDINSIHENEGVEVSAACIPDKIVDGSIYHISDMLDEETRSVQVYIKCDNSKRELKPGMYVSVRFIEQPSSKILIPSSAVFQEEDSSFVFVFAGNNKYTKRNVALDGATNGKLLLISGLQENERIVSEGGYYLLEIN